MEASRTLAPTPGLAPEETAALAAICAKVRPTCIRGELRINDRMAEAILDGQWPALCAKLERLSIISPRERGVRGNIYRIDVDRARRLLN